MDMKAKARNAIPMLNKTNPKIISFKPNAFSLKIT